MAIQANKSARQSGEVVANAVDAMGKIEQSSNQISNIIGVIDDIAFQTNLLALNAGVEAARAGEAGKGFAVVATEVKELASQTAKATEEIGAQIASVQQATQETVTAIQDIARTITEMSQISTSIAATMPPSCGVRRAIQSTLCARRWRPRVGRQ